MQSILRYPGAKNAAAVQQLIMSHAPKAFLEYREPFAGSAAICFAVGAAVPRWINDKHPGLMSVWKALHDCPQDFIARCRTISPAEHGEAVVTMPSGKQYPKRLYDLFHQMLVDEAADAALRYLFLNRMSWNGRVILDPLRRSRNYFSNPRGWSIVHTARMERAAAQIQGTRITCGDYLPLLEEPGEGVFIYADIPYVSETKRPPSAKLYEVGFTWSDHHRFALAARNCRHNLLISLDDDPVVWELYKGFHIRRAEWRYMGTKDRKMGSELIITNYPIETMQLPPIDFGDNEAAA